MSSCFENHTELIKRLNVDNTNTLNNNSKNLQAFNCFESAYGPSPINYENWSFIRKHNSLEKQPPIFMVKNWPNLTVLVKNLVRHALIQRSKAYQDFRQRIPDILAFSRNLPDDLQLCRQELRSDQNYNQMALIDKQLNLKNNNSLVDIDSKVVAQRMLERFDQAYNPEEINAQFNPKNYSYNLFAGDELFKLPLNFEQASITLEPWAEENLQELENMVKTHSLNPNGLKAGTQEFTKIFPKLRQQAELNNETVNVHLKREPPLAHSPQNSQQEELDILLAMLLEPQPNIPHIWFKGWRLALQGVTLGLFVAVSSALLAINPNGFDLGIRFQRAFLQLQLAAAHNEPFSCFLLAWLCRKNFSLILKDTPHDIAQKYLKRAANLGLDIAMLELAKATQNAEDPPYAKDNYMILAARQGHPLALREASQLACSKLMYFKGFDWGWLLMYMYNLLQPQDITIFSPVGIMFINGQGIPCDKYTAFQLFNALAPINLDACYMLGIMFFNANGVAQDYAKAQYYFEFTAPYQIFDSHALLGFLYESGEGGTLDKDKAIDQYHMGFWIDYHSDLREYCAERLIHLKLKKLQEAIKNQDSIAEKQLRLDVLRILRRCTLDFTENQKAWQMRLDEFSKATNLTNLSFFHG